MQNLEKDHRLITFAISIPQKTIRALDASAQYFNSNSAAVAGFYVHLGLHIQKWVTDHHISSGDYPVFTIDENGLVNMNISGLKTDMLPPHQIKSISIRLDQQDFYALMEKQTLLGHERIGQTMGHYLAQGMLFHSAFLAGNLNDWQEMIADISE